MAQVRPLNEVLQKAAIEQLNEVPERIPADIEALRTWINQQPYLKARTDDQFLLSFLRGCKFSLEKAKNKIDKFYTMRTKFPELLSCYDVDEAKIREILRLGVFLNLPTPLNDNGPFIGIFRLGAYTPNKHAVEDIFRVSTIMQEITMMESDHANIYGVVHILDMDKATSAHMFQMTPGLMKKSTVFSEEAIPLRLKGTHFLNTFAAFEPVFNMVKPMLSKKQQNRLFVHGSKLESLYEQIPKKYLPKEYGGENSSVDEIIETWVKKVESYREYFKENENYVTNEALRLGKPIDFDGLFGTEGSFRKLNVD